MMHSADLEKSERLKRVLAALERAGERGLTSLELQEAARTCAPSTCVSEIRHQGIDVECTQEQHDGRRRWRYRLPAHKQKDLF